MSIEDGWILKGGSNYSGVFSFKFLWKHGPVYVMDNHRFALWCWAQEVNGLLPHSMLHIDRHTDTLQDWLEAWIPHVPKLKGLSIEDYLKVSYRCESSPDIDTPVFRWDNHLSIHFRLFGDHIRSCLFATEGIGDPPNHERVHHLERADLPLIIRKLGKADGPWIVDIDLDYFFKDEGGGQSLAVQEEYLVALFAALDEKIIEGTVAVVTIALTPNEDLTGGWVPTLRLAGKVLAEMGIDFSPAAKGIADDWWPPLQL